jgi:hypothetical protein
MAWDEAKAWMSGTLTERLYQNLLNDAVTAPLRNSRRKKIVRPEDMPWEMSRQGLLKHLLNEQMNTRMETVDAYMQVIPPGSRSGKHRHADVNKLSCAIHSIPKSLQEQLPCSPHDAYVQSSRPGPSRWQPR